MKGSSEEYIFVPTNYPIVKSTKSDLSDFQNISQEAHAMNFKIYE